MVKPLTCENSNMNYARVVLLVKKMHTFLYHETIFGENLRAGAGAGAGAGV